MTDKQEQEPQKSLRKTTLKDLGPNLPIIPKNFGGDGTNLTFQFNDWDMAMEEKLSKHLKKSENTGKFVTSMFGEMVDQMCGVDFQSLSVGERALKMNQFEFPNVMYVYIYMRVEELGKDLQFNPFPCPHPTCGKLIKDFVADLETLEISTKWDVGEDGKPVELARSQEFELFKPIKLDDGKVITKLLLDVAKWDFMEQTNRDEAESIGIMKRLMFESSITGVHDMDGLVKDFVDLQTIIRKLKKRDIELCMKEVTENNGGPEMAMEGKCPHCHSVFYKQIDWRYDSFFDSSSL